MFDAHVALGGRMVDFGGWALPVQYSSILAEHAAVREAVGLFDVSHMGEVEFLGRGALAAVERLVTNDVRGLADGQARYTAVCYEDGGIVDDCIVYRLAPERILIVVNASNRHKDVAWFRQHSRTGPDLEIRDISDETALIAVQGPKAAELLRRLAEDDASRAALAAARSFTVVQVRLAGLSLMAARTGYTAEDGFEVFVPAAQAPALWQALLTRGADLGVLPCGLGARDTLRLEGCLSLYGNDIDATTPYEAGLGWVVKLDHDFIGRAALERQKAAGVTRRLSSMVMEGRGTARHGYEIYGQESGGERVGVVTSGSLGPTVGKNIAMGYVPTAMATPGTRLYIDCRGKRVPAVTVKAPFYKRK